MHPNDPLPASPAPPGSLETEPVEAAPWDVFVAGARWKKLRWFLARAVALGGGFLVLVATLTGFAGWYTSRPQFCRSCHIMEPYYVSWEHSSHKDVSCVKCHFPPGAGEKVRGKLLGLVQLTKYITGSAGPRPAAEVSDASCLRSGCHETRLLSGRMTFKGIPFDHRPHVEETRRGKQLRCTSCHSQIVQGSHMTVTTSTCFLCHFKEGHFNEGLGACTRCHQIPDKDFDLGGGVVFHHNLAYERGVDCTNCHGDLIRGKGDVPRERCGVCHNRESDFQKITDHEFVHYKHVTEHKVDCLHCHLEIHHSLDKDKLVHAAADCASCHPNHHQEQVRMLHGGGAKTPLPGAEGQPESRESMARMSVVRIACPSCHKQQQVSATGTVLWKGSIETCAACHDADKSSSFEVDHHTLRASVTEIEKAITRVRQALAAADPQPARAAAMETELDRLQYDVSFLRIGNDIHNMHYAKTLTRALVDQLTALCRELRIEEPQVTLPASITRAAPSTAEPASEAKKTPAPEEPPAPETKPEPEKPAEPEKPQASEKPMAAEKPADGEKPQAAEKPAGEPPAAAEKPSDAPPPKEPEPAPPAEPLAKPEPATDSEKK